MDDAEEMLQKNSTIDITTGCWNWNRCVQHNGYGRVRHGGKTVYAHRLAYMIFCGKLEDKKDVCHTCDNRKCVNPSHLFLGTRKENMQDAVKKGRQAKRDKLPASKIKENEISTIMDRVKLGERYASIAKDYGVHRCTIGQIAIKQGVHRHGCNNK